MLGLLLIDHGSRRADANTQLEDMAGRVRRLRPDAVVGIAHLELAEPTIAKGLAALAAAGATEIVALPYFLSDGRHVSEDIPLLLREAGVRLRGVSVRCGAPLGPHDALASLLLERGGLGAPGA
jgi:sirohydrochlorin ferrochelatase